MLLRYPFLHSISVSISVMCIGDDGGKVKLYGCSAKFQSKTLEQPKNVRVTVDTSDHDIPEGCIPIGPALGCGASGAKLKKPVILKIESYFVLEDEDAIEVWTKKSKGGEWIRVPAITFGKDKRKIKFEVQHFCWFAPVRRIIKSFLNPDPTMIMSNYLYYSHRRGSFLVLFCVDDKKTQDDCISNIERDGYYRVLPLPDVTAVKVSESVECRLESVSSELTVKPAAWEKLDLSNLLREKHRQFYFHLRPVPRTARDLDFILKIGSNPKSTPVTVESQTINEIEDILSDVTDVDVIDSPELKFREHRGKTGIYQISENPDQKGKVLIINNEFQKVKNPRKGSEQDVRNMNELWKKMGFKVRVEQNLTADEMKHRCEEFARDTESASVRVLILMSHGTQVDGQDVIKGECGGTVMIKNILREFDNDRCPHLSGIPKILIFQCCRGPRADKGVLVDDELDTTSRQPTSCDTFVVHASLPGKASHRRETTGSWLINAITNVFKVHACDQPISTLFEKVNGKVSTETGRVTIQGKRTETKQVCVATTTLSKQLYLFPGYPKPSLVRIPMTVSPDF